jgi:two-component system, OmpR family, response regulator
MNVLFNVERGGWPGINSLLMGWCENCYKCLTKFDQPMSPSHTPSKSQEILCIEQHGELCLLLGKMLFGRPIHIKHAKNTAEAANFLKEQQPDLVLIEDNFFEDIGIRYIAQLKATLPVTKVIMVSSRDGSTRVMAKNAGADAFLTKPFTKTELLESVMSLINASQNA